MLLLEFIFANHIVIDMESLGLAFNKSCQKFQTHPDGPDPDASKVIDLLIKSSNIKDFVNWSNADGNTGFMH